MEKESRTVVNDASGGHTADPLRSGIAYLTAAMLVAAAGWLYELFSHGVYSNYMVYAFMVPLAAGALPDLLAAARGSRGKKRSGCGRAAHAAAALRLAAIVTLTAGSLVKGVLDIYGTTSRLVIIYPVAGICLMAASLLIFAKQSRASGHSVRA